MKLTRRQLRYLIIEELAIEHSSMNEVYDGDEQGLYNYILAIHKRLDVIEKKLNVAVPAKSPPPTSIKKIQPLGGKKIQRGEEPTASNSVAAPGSQQG